MGYSSDFSTPHQAPNEVGALVNAVASLTPAKRQRFFRQLKDRGILERPPRGEYRAERNERIRAKRRRGLSPGQIGKQEGMTRNAVRMVLYRDKRARHVRKTCASTPKRPPAKLKSRRKTA